MTVTAKHTGSIGSHQIAMVVLVRLSVPMQVIDWKDLSPK